MIAGRKRKPQLLFVSPVIPNVTGNGMAMRAGVVLEELAKRYDVSLVAAPMHGPIHAALPARIAGLCRDVRMERVDPSKAATSFLASLRLAWPKANDGRGPGAHPGIPFDAVHVFRLTALPYAATYLDAPRGIPELYLDLDETESFTRRRLAALYRSNGEAALARFAELEANLCEKLERDVVARFDRVYVCSETERRALGAPDDARIEVLPNVLPVEAPLPPAPDDGTFAFLFVGTLAFYQNEDAVVWLCREVLPRLRASAPRAFEISIVGFGATERVRALAAASEVRVIGAVEQVEPCYRRAHAVLVPLRAAGGTRIKVLEAMRYGRPIVSTPDGIEGFDVRSGEHVLVAADAEQFAQECLRLMHDAELGARIARNAYEFFLRAHTPAAMAPVLHGARE